jgi:hypothetical protein
VFTEAGLDRRYYELRPLTEFRMRCVRETFGCRAAGNFKDLEGYLLPTAAFEALFHRAGQLNLDVQKMS